MLVQPWHVPRSQWNTIVKIRRLFVGTCRHGARTGDNTCHPRSAIIARTWECMSNNQVALWIDSYRHARRSLDPIRVDITLDCTAIAVVAISKPPQLLTYGGHPVLHTLPSKIGTTAAEIVVRLQRLCDFIETPNDSPVDCTMIRVPLDVMRPDAAAQQWQPRMPSAQKPWRGCWTCVACFVHCKDTQGTQSPSHLT